MPNLGFWDSWTPTISLLLTTLGAADVLFKLVLRGVRGGSSLAVVLLLGSMLAGPGLAQEGARGGDTKEATQAEPQGSSSDPFTDAVEVRLIEIDVSVFDKKGRRVEGLTRDDFVLFADGQPVEIADFEEVPVGELIAVPERKWRRWFVRMPTSTN